MKSSELHERINKLNVDENTKKGLLEIIDLKIEDDMNAFSKEITAFGKELERTEKSLKSEINSLKFTNKLMVGILIAIFSAVIAVVIKTYIK